MPNLIPTVYDAEDALLQLVDAGVPKDALDLFGQRMAESATAFYPPLQTVDPKEVSLFCLFYVLNQMTLENILDLWVPALGCGREELRDTLSQLLPLAISEAQRLQNNPC